MRCEATVIHEPQEHGTLTTAVETAGLALQLVLERGCAAEKNQITKLKIFGAGEP